MRTNQQTKLTVEEVKAIQDLRRVALRKFDLVKLDAVEKAYINPMFALVNSALTKLENQIS